MKPLSLFASCIALASPLFGATRIDFEAGASYFDFRHTRLESGSTVFAVDEPSEAAPFVAATYRFTERFGLRLTYHYLQDVHTTAEFGSLPGSQLPIVVWGHYEDDVHLLSLAPEYSWSLTPRLSFAVAPELNWMASRGMISYSTTNPAVLLVGPRARDKEGFTFGGSLRLRWSLGPRAAITAGYQQLDLNPSFDREAQVFSGGLQWKF